MCRRRDGTLKPSLRGALRWKGDAVNAGTAWRSRQIVE